jgi:hypothetical protein
MEMPVLNISLIKLTNFEFSQLKPYFKKKQIILSHIRTYTNIDQ